ncbi:MAG TPA: glycine--tRNA ligase subunit beta [Caulobacteraceae bacterium]|nr:glycine--tRNA ligase subunit beta [Caulobacteraceae bacterium]
MPQLLLELFSEEIPARMQGQAARDLERMTRERLAAAGLTPESLTAYAGPRRLTLVAEGLPAAQADRKEELKGPKTTAPDQALEGFLRKTGLTRDRLVERDGVWFATLEAAGRPTSAVVAEMVDHIIRNFPWPKSMTWGSGKLRWVRPLHRILCLFDGAVTPFEVEGIMSTDVTEGHRFMAPRKPVQVHDFASYRANLKARHVILEAAERKAIILDAARALCAERRLELVEDEGLLDEVAGLAEWPVPILGDMDRQFLDLPPEVIRTSMRTHQKFFAVRDPSTGKLAAHFVAVANIEANDGGKTIAAGNAKVLSARLSDARFFWDEDRKVALEQRLEKLKGVTFHAKLGTMYARVERIETLAREIAPLVGADPDVAARAARLAKADLATGMVGEFPELQGLMGGYYAEAEHLPPQIAHAIRDHYKPVGPNDSVPNDSVSVAVALADKLDTLRGFFSIDEKPTGSRDPFALRRAALGVIRIVQAKNLRFGLAPLVKGSRHLLDFFADRLKVSLRDEGKRHDLVDAVFALGDDDLVRIVARVEALSSFLATEDGANLLAGYKRATNILKAEEKKGKLPTGIAVAMKDAPAEEGALIAALADTEPKVAKALQVEDFEAAMRGLATLRAPVDAFFDMVLVNSTLPEERDNRLRLLAQVRDAMGRVADFSLISG